MEFRSYIRTEDGWRGTRKPPVSLEQGSRPSQSLAGTGTETPIGVLRNLSIQAISDRSAVWDCLVIGGGATGLGTAVEAASRGLRTLLVEKTDFAKGTSSRATKLAHGGVRYLAQGNISLVREALRERGLMLKDAPNLAHPLKLVIPAFRTWEIPYYTIGLGVYDLMAGKLSLGRSAPEQVGHDWASPNRRTKRAQ